MQRLLLIALVVLSAFIGAVTGVIMTLRYLDDQKPYTSIEQQQNLRLAGSGLDSAYRATLGPDLEAASRQSTRAVVHIKTGYGPGDFSINPLDRYYRRPMHSSGSGVIISDDGYIVTNHHVIEDASSVEVTMSNNQHFYAKVIGKDPSTDLALLKIKARGLPFLAYGNSDQVVTGQWVLAVGNPFDLNSTVTAGIISAKARNIGILRENNNNLEIESFLQTDAAVNPGNSGGALVNLRGELIGINSAIATSTGSYSGYSFAIPINLVKKVMDDLLEFGSVQRGLLGVVIRSVNADLTEEKGLDVVQGVYVDRVNEGSAAQDAGLLEGDVLTAINHQPVGSNSELQELVARHRPGHVVQVTYRRAGEEKTIPVTLRNTEGREGITRMEVDHEIQGATFEDLPYSELASHRLEGGVLVQKLDDGPWKSSGLRDGFIITHLDKVPVDNVEDLNRMLAYKNGGILIEGIYRNGESGVYGLTWRRQ